MQFFQPVRDRKHAKSLVDQVVAAIEQAIRSQVLRSGMALPSVRAFARVHGVSPFTVSAAYSRLVAQNWLVARPGAGYRVAARPVSNDVSSSARALDGWVPPALGAAWLLADVFADHSIPIKSGCGWLPPEWLDEAGLRQALCQVARTPVNQLAGYGHPYGYYPLRESICQALAAHGLPLVPDQVLLTQGATQGLDIVIRTLLQPGDVIAVELPSYANILPTLRLAGLKVCGISRNEDGLALNELDALAQQEDLKALFVTTVLHNPTGTSLSMSNAFRVLQLAEQHDFRIIEDDVSRDLLPDLGPMLAAMAGAGRVIQVSGFSKSIMPSMRVGYIAADAALVREFAKTKMALGLTTPEMMERTVYQVLRQGRHRAHLQRIQERLRDAHDELCGLMDEHGLEIYARPRAGLFLWARLPGAWREQGAAQLAEMALRDGIWLAPGAYFDPEQAHTGWVRFNVAYSRHTALWKFILKALQASP